MNLGLVFTGQIERVYRGVEPAENNGKPNPRAGEVYVTVTVNDPVNLKYERFKLYQEHGTLPDREGVQAWVGLYFRTPVALRVWNGQIYMNIPRGARPVIAAQDALDSLAAA